MRIKQKVLGVAVMILLSGLLYAQTDSTAAVRLLNNSRMQKANGNVQQYLARTAQAQTGEHLQQGKFTIILTGLANGQYEVQVYRMVPFGKKRVQSTFASLYQSGIEYSYRYDAQSQSIKQYHFICPPNSLTCWSNPKDYAIFQEFDWQEQFPSKNCSQSVFTSEEYGREYLQASCFSNRDAALGFAQKFIGYVSRNRF
jgi:hypothetical protein